MGKLLIVGCGHAAPSMFYGCSHSHNDAVTIDINEHLKPDLVMDIQTLSDKDCETIRKFSEGEPIAIVLENLPNDLVPDALRIQAIRILRAKFPNTPIIIRGVGMLDIFTFNQYKAYYSHNTAILPENNECLSKLNQARASEGALDHYFKKIGLNIDELKEYPLGDALVLEVCHLSHRFSPPFADQEQALMTRYLHQPWQNKHFVDWVFSTNRTKVLNCTYERLGTIIQNERYSASTTKEMRSLRLMVKSQAEKSSHEISLTDKEVLCKLCLSYYLNRNRYRALHNTRTGMVLSQIALEFFVVPAATISLNEQIPRNTSSAQNLNQFFFEKPEEIVPNSIPPITAMNP